MTRLLVRNDRVLRLFAMLLVVQVAIFILSFVAPAILPSPDEVLARLGNSEIGLFSGEDSPQTVSSPLERLVVESTQVPGDASRAVVYEVSRGDTFSSIWTKNGAPYAGALGAAKALRDVKVPTTLRAGDSINLTVSMDGDIIGFSKDLGDGRTVVLTGSSLNGYEAEVLEADIEETPREITGVILSSFAASARGASIPPSLVDDFVDLFSSRVEFRKDLHPGDTFSVNYVERTCKRRGAQLSPGDITSASLKTVDGLMVAVGYRGKDGKMRFFDERGEPLGNYFLRYPLKFSRISSTFSTARFHPVLNRSRPHNGVDFAAPVGTPVRSVADGVVVQAGYNGGAGNMVRIQHGDRYATEYFHLSRVASGLRKGAKVSRGDVIGLVGTTGLSTGPHLHFGFFVNNQYVDPMRVRLPSMSDGFGKIPSPVLVAALDSIRRQHETVTVASRNGDSSAG